MSRGRRVSLPRLGWGLVASVFVSVTLLSLLLSLGAPATSPFASPLSSLHRPAHVSPSVSFVTSVDCSGTGCTTPSLTAPSVTTSIIVIASVGNNTSLTLSNLNDSQHRPISPASAVCHNGNENLTIGFLNYVGPGTIAVNIANTVHNPLVTVLEVSGGPLLANTGMNFGFSGEDCYGPATGQPGFLFATANSTQVGYPAVVAFAVGNQHAPGNNCSGTGGSVVLYNYVASDHGFGTQCSGYQVETVQGVHGINVTTLHTANHPIDGLEVPFVHDDTYGTGGLWALNFSHSSQSGFPPSAGFNFTATSNVSLTPNSLFTWGWGDGNYSHGNTTFEAVNQSHNYSVGGSYSVWLNVTNSHGFRNVSHSLLVGVPSPPPPPHGPLDWLWIVAIICSSVFVGGLVLTRSRRGR